METRQVNNLTNEEIRARLESVNSITTYQDALPTVLCPRCASDVVCDAGLYNCPCGASWSNFFRVKLPKVATLLRRVANAKVQTVEFEHITSVMSEHVNASKKRESAPGAAYVDKRARGKHYRSPRSREMNNFKPRVVERKKVTDAEVTALFVQAEKHWTTLIETMRELQQVANALKKTTRFIDGYQMEKALNWHRPQKMSEHLSGLRAHCYREGIELDPNPDGTTEKKPAQDFTFNSFNAGSPLDGVNFSESLDNALSKLAEKATLLGRDFLSKSGDYVVTVHPVTKVERRYPLPANKADVARLVEQIKQDIERDNAPATTPTPAPALVESEQSFPGTEGK